MEDTKKTGQQHAEPGHKRKKGKAEGETNPFIDSMTLINKSYVYEFASEAYCRDHGRARKEVVGNSVAQIWGETRFKFIKKHLDKDLKETQFVGVQIRDVKILEIHIFQCFKHLKENPFCVRHRYTIARYFG